MPLSGYSPHSHWRQAGPGCSKQQSRRTGPPIMPTDPAACNRKQQETHDETDAIREGRIPAPPPSRPAIARRPGQSLLLGRDHHDHLPAFQARTGLDHDVITQIGLDPAGHFATQFLMAHFTTTEADIDLDLVTLFQETAHVAQLDLVVALVRDRTELHF